MTEKAQNFEIYQGDTKQITIPVKDETGAAKALTGSSQKWEAWNGTVLAIQKTDGDISLVDTDLTDGVVDDGIRFTIDPADTASLAAGVYTHEAEVTDSASNVSTVTRGAMKVLDDLIT